MYKELIARLRTIHPEEYDNPTDFAHGAQQAMCEAADAIENILHAAKRMHTWIFLNSVDEQDAYDECGLSPEMNAELGYIGALRIQTKPQEEDENAE